MPTQHTETQRQCFLTPCPPHKQHTPLNLQAKTWPWQCEIRDLFFPKEKDSWLHSCPDLCLDHVDASRAEGFHTVVDIHHAFTLSHVQHDVQHDVAAGAACSCAVTETPLQYEDHTLKTSSIHCFKLLKILHNLSQITWMFSGESYFHKKKPTCGTRIHFILFKFHFPSMLSVALQFLNWLQFLFQTENEVNTAYEHLCILLLV